MDYLRKRDLILHGPMLKVILVLSGPVMLTNFIQTLYNLVDTYFVGWLGTTEIASVQFIWPVIFLMMSIGMGLSLASTSLISQYTGADSHEKAKKSCRTNINPLHSACGDHWFHRIHFYWSLAKAHAR